ncbi:MAG: hypothetical protein AAFZ18_31345 [Myxococcota bacterium]
MLHEAIKEKASFDRMEEALKSTLEALEADDSTGARLETYMREKVTGIHDLADALSQAEDREDLYRTLAHFWIELRVEWDRYNNVMNFQLMSSGEQDPLVVAKGTACSEILTWLEDVMAEEDLSAMADFCSEPLDRIRAEVERISGS